MEICLGKVLSLSKLQIWARKNGRHPEINGEKKRQEMTFKTCDEKASSQILDQTFQHDNALVQATPPFYVFVLSHRVFRRGRHGQSETNVFGMGLAQTPAAKNRLVDGAGVYPS